MTIIIFNAIWTCRLSVSNIGREDIMNLYGKTSFDETFWDFDDAMERLSRYNVFVAESTGVAVAFAVITFIIIGGVFVLSRHNTQSPLKRSEQIRYIGLTLLAYSNLLFLLTFWLGHISVLIRQGGAATTDIICSQYNLFIQEVIFIVADIGFILFAYSMWKFLLYVFKKSRNAGWVFAVLEIIIIFFTLFCFIGILAFTAHYV